MKYTLIAYKKNQSVVALFIEFSIMQDALQNYWIFTLQFILNKLKETSSFTLSSAEKQKKDGRTERSC